MSANDTMDQCLVLKVGVIASGTRCLSVMRTLNATKPVHLRFRLVGIAPVSKSIACYKYAGEMDIDVFDDYRDMLALDQLDFILELTGERQILADMVKLKSSAVGILDRQASMLLLDIATLYEQVEHKETDISLVSSFASALLEASPDGVMVIDRDFNIIKCNDSPLITGSLGSKHAIGKSCFEIIHGNEKPYGNAERMCPVQETLRTGHPTRVVHESTRPNGEAQVTQVTAYPIFNQMKEIVQLVVTIRDISQELTERVEKRTQAIKNDLEQFVQEDRLASLGRLVASVCHEINNPIASIVTFNKLMLSYLKENRLPPEGEAGFQRYLELSVREAMRCGSIVTNLLTFARQKSVEAREIDLKGIINTILQLIQHQLEAAQVSLEVTLPEKSFTSWGDKAQIQQCLMNLIFNAIESMPEGGKLTIEGELDQGHDMASIAIADEGEGIPPEDLPRIFEPFYTTKDENKGVGLGLSMTYGIIRAHKGTLEVKSQQGEGTLFIIKLPSRPAEGMTIGSLSSTT